LLWGFRHLGLAALSWVAVAPKGAELRIGAAVQTEDMAREKLFGLLGNWVEKFKEARNRPVCG
jgi:hypothetical protein